MQDAEADLRANPLKLLASWVNTPHKNLQQCVYCLHDAFCKVLYLLSEQGLGPEAVHTASEAPRKMYSCMMQLMDA